MLNVSKWEEWEMNKLLLVMTVPLLLSLSSCSLPSSDSADPKPTESKQVSVLKSAEITDYSLADDDFLSKDFSALIYNPNETESLFDIEVEALGIGENDAVLDQLEFTISSLRAGETWVLSDLIDKEVVQLEIKVSDGTTRPEVKTERLPENSLSEIETEYSADLLSVYVQNATTKGVITVPDDAPHSRVTLCAAYFGKSKEFLGGICEDLDVFAGRKTGFEIYGNIQPQSATDVKLYVRYSNYFSIFP
jgi:hypothetical protein